MKYDEHMDQVKRQVSLVYAKPVKPAFDFDKVCEALRFKYGLNYDQVGRWLIRRGHVKDMEHIRS